MKRAVGIERRCFGLSPAANMVPRLSVRLSASLRSVASDTLVMDIYGSESSPGSAKNPAEPGRIRGNLNHLLKVAFCRRNVATFAWRCTAALAAECQFVCICNYRQSPEMRGRLVRWNIRASGI